MSTASEMYALYLEAEKKLLQGQTIEMNGRRLTRSGLADVVAERKVWERRLAAENNKGRGFALASLD